MGITLRKITEKIVSILLDILIVLVSIVLLVFIYNNIQTKILKNDYPSIFGFTTFEVITGSMKGDKEDSIDAGDWIIVKQTNNIQLEDVISYQKDGAIITHRVIEEYNGTYITKGDANNAKDDPVSREQIVGKVVKILPSFGIIRKTILNPYVLISLIISFYLIGYALRSIRKDKEKIKTKKITEKVDDVVTNVLDKVFDSKSESKPKKESVTDKYDFIETEIDVSRTVSDEFDEFEDEDEEIVLTELDMDKTMYFRKVSVSKNDVDYINSQTIAENFDTDAMEMTDVELESASEDEVKKCIDVINTKNKKFKNVIDKIMYIKKHELENVLTVLNKKEKLKTNESTIIDILTDSYLNYKYYETEKNNRKSLNVKINDGLKEVGTYLVKSYKGKDKYYSDKVSKYVNYLMLVNDLEQIDKLFNNIQARKENYNNKLLATFKSELSSPGELKEMVNSIIKIKKIHESVINETINKLMSNTFQLEIEEIYEKNKLYSAKLVHNINFSKVYSDYIVDKTYSEGIIAEDKVLVLITLLLVNIIKEIFSGEEKKKYLIYLPESIYKKTNKFDKVLALLNNEIAKDRIILYNSYNEIINNKRIMKTLKKDGYQFAIGFNKDNNIKEKDASYIGLADYLFCDSKIIKEIELLNHISTSDKEKLIKEDIYMKVVN